MPTKNALEKSIQCRAPKDAEEREPFPDGNLEHDGIPDRGAVQE
jgi:hypothetical protein